MGGALEDDQSIDLLAIRSRITGSALLVWTRTLVPLVKQEVIISDMDLP